MLTVPFPSRAARQSRFLPVSEGEQLIDEFRLVNCLATGNTSQVWEVAEEGTNQHFAIKLLLEDAFKDAEQKKVLKHEASVAKTLDHPNLIKFHKLAITKQHAYIVMDYFRAPNLKPQIMGDITGLHVRIRRLVEQLSLALGYMHDQSWLHRDIKPENILFTKGSELRLIDFSLSSRHAKGIGKVFAGKSKTIQGTRTYIAPETIRKHAATPQTDIYSLGITLYEVLTGGPPFKGSSPNDLLKKHLSTAPVPPSAVNTNVTPEMDRFILRMLAKKPADRPKSMAEIYSEFRTVKVFKEDVQELEDQRQKKEKAALTESLASVGRLDSRADAQRRELGIAAPVTKKKKLAVAGEKQQAAKAAAGAAAPAPPQGGYPSGQGFPQFPGGQGYPPGFAPGMPGAPAPYPYPGQLPFPGQSYPPMYPQPPFPQQGYPQSQGAPVGQGGPPQQFAPQPPQQIPPPPQQRPPQPPPSAAPQPAARPQAPAPQVAAPQPQRPAAAPQPQQPAPPRPAPPPAAKKPAAPAPGADLPLMEELPEVI